MLTREEKEKLVIKLYEQGKNVREISKEAHMSFGDIGNVIRKYTGEAKTKEQKPLSKNTQALKLFYEGKSPTEAAIALDMSPIEITDIYHEFLKLNNLFEFIVIYKRIEKHFSSFIKLYDLMDSCGIGELDVLNLIHLSNDIKKLNDYFNDILVDINQITIQKENMLKELNNLKKKIEEAEQLLISIDLEIKLKKYMSNNKFELKEDDQGKSIIKENKLK